MKKYIKIFYSSFFIIISFFLKALLPEITTAFPPMAIQEKETIDGSTIPIIQE
jgi:hypothetical protein